MVWVEVCLVIIGASWLVKHTLSPVVFVFRVTWLCVRGVYRFFKPKRSLERPRDIRLKADKFGDIYVAMSPVSDSESEA